MHAHLYVIDNEKQKEHDCTVSGVDSNRYVRLIVTSDVGGSIKLWSLEKRFLREIQFPDPIDSVCFVNERGDILVSHVSRISKIKYETYWTSSFTNFGFTDINDPIHLEDNNRRIVEFEFTQKLTLIEIMETRVPDTKL